MKRHLWYYVVAAVIAVVGVVSFGVPTSSLWLVGFLVLCPLMMIVMMWGMRGGNDHGGDDRTGDQSRGDLTEDHDRHSWPRS